MRPSVSIFHQPSHTTWKYCLSVTYESGHKLGSLRCEIGVSLIRYRINKSSQPLWQISKVTFTKIYWLVLEATLKSKEPFTLSYILSLPMQPCHIPNPSGHWLTIYSVRMSPPLFTTLAVFLLKFTYIYVMPIFFSRNTSLVATKSHALHTTWNGLTDRANKYMNKEGNSH